MSTSIMCGQYIFTITTLKCCSMLNSLVYCALAMGFPVLWILVVINMRYLIAMNSKHVRKNRVHNTKNAKHKRNTT